MSRFIFKLLSLIIIIHSFGTWGEGVQPARRPLDIDNPNSPLRKLPSGGIQGLGDPRKRNMGRRLASLGRRGNRRADWFLGPHASFEGPMAMAPSSDSLSKGLGFGAGLEFSYRTPLIRFAFQPAYRQVSLGRKLGGAQGIHDPSPVDVTQKIQFLGTGGWVSLVLEEGGGPGVFEPAWWIDFGTEFLLPVKKGLQTSSYFGDVSFQADKLWLVLLGSTLDFETPGNDLLKMGLHLFYNLPGNAQGRLFGVRAQIAFDFGLM